MIPSKRLMKFQIISIAPDASMLDAYKLMFDKKIRHLPVFDRNHKLVGILSERDVERAMLVDKKSPVSQEISLNSEKLVEDFMSYPVFSVHEQSPIVNVIETIINKKVSAVMVENTSGEWTGIISTDDLLIMFSDILRREEELKAKPLSFYMPNTLF